MDGIAKNPDTIPEMGSAQQFGGHHRAEDACHSHPRTLENDEEGEQYRHGLSEKESGGGGGHGQETGNRNPQR